jgi:CheY-like chemotaxis protein
MNVRRSSSPPEDFDFRDVVEDVLEDIAREAHPRGIEVVGDIEDDVPRAISAPRLQVRRELYRLMSEAVEHAERGSVSLHVRTAARTADDVRLRITIASSAGGSSAEATFERRDAPSGTIAVSAFAGTKVLVLDDDWTQRRAIRRKLRAWGCEVHEATSAVDAILHLAATHNDPFDVILVDGAMPEMDGIEAARAIRRNTQTYDVAFVLMSAFGVHALADAFAAVVAKPIRRAHLLKALRAAVGPSRQSFESPRAKMLAT